jgi:hypothetical protein
MENDFPIFPTNWEKVALFERRNCVFLKKVIMGKKKARITWDVNMPK